MSTNPPTTPPEPLEQQYMTEEDGDAMFASILWFEEFNEAGGTLAYQNQFVGILGEQIIAYAPSREELRRQLNAMGNTIPRFRVAVRYVGSVENPF